MKTRSIISNDTDDQCFICGRRPDHIHHMLHGSRRAAADKYGLTCHLCHECHTALHDRGVMDRELQALAQIAFEKRYGHEEFMRIFGKNYKEDGL